VNFTVLIPARLASTRLPRKVLLDIGGLPMIEQVRRRALESGAQRVVVAADDRQIVECIHRFGGEALMTSPAHRCGSERLAEAARLLGLADEEIVVNLQGDEPAMDPLLIRAVAELLAESSAPVATVAVPIGTVAELLDPHVVKVALAADGCALYFSRAPIPWRRDDFPPAAGAQPTPGSHWRHLGLYSYRQAFLQAYAAWPAGVLEELEALEQLRILERGHRILVYRARQAPLGGVDTAEDLARVRRGFGAARHPSAAPAFSPYNRRSDNPWI